MARQIVVNGEVLARVKGAQGTAIANIAELGLAESPTTITLRPKTRDVNLDAWGNEVPMDVQTMLADVLVTMNLLHTDLDVFEECARLAMGGAAQFGMVARAGTLMGGGVARFQPGYKFVGLNLSSPVLNRPWRIVHAYMIDPIGGQILGTQKTIIPVTFRGILYTTDPWQGGLGATNQILLDRTPDT